jgi:hypothetical protein
VLLITAGPHCKVKPLSAEYEAASIIPVVPHIRLSRRVPATLLTAIASDLPVREVNVSTVVAEDKDTAPVDSVTVACRTAIAVVDEL